MGELGAPLEGTVATQLQTTHSCPFLCAACQELLLSHSPCISHVSTLDFFSIHHSLRACLPSPPAPSWVPSISTHSWSHDGHLQAVGERGFLPLDLWESAAQK